MSRHKLNLWCLKFHHNEVEKKFNLMGAKCVVWVTITTCYVWMDTHM
jgi:hypothetical protein